MNQNVENNEYLQAMGIQQWVPRAGSSLCPVDFEQPAIDSNETQQNEVLAAKALSESDLQPQFESSKGDRSPNLEEQPLNEVTGLEYKSNDTVDSDAEQVTNLEQLRTLICNCHKCQIANERTNTVFGVGNPNADLMIIGEAPGADEDKQGEPFVGRAGQLLDKMLGAIGFSRNQVFIANILKCRPTNNRDPQKEEVANCIGYLNKQIELIKPKLILSVGRVSAQNLLGRETPISQLRGKPHEYGTSGIPLLATYHPAYLLRSPSEKAKAWDDLKFARFLLSQTEN